MDDWQILMRGGDEHDIETYANQTNGHDLSDDDEWAFDRHRDEETIDRFLEERGEPKLFPDESNVY